MEIAKGILSSDYLKLNLENKTSYDWDVAFEYLRKRLTERFIEPADRLVEFESELRPSDKKYGFAILAIDFLLCETIQAFYFGEKESIKISRDLIIAFLKDRDGFKKYFKEEKQAIDFYKNFRCGILHQAQTSAYTKVWSVGDLITNNGKFIIVNRDLFHKKVKEELNIYLKKLHDRADNILLDNFKVKMDFIAGA